MYFDVIDDITISYNMVKPKVKWMDNGNLVSFHFLRQKTLATWMSLYNIKETA